MKKDEPGPRRRTILALERNEAEPVADDVSAAAAGDSRAFERVYRQYVPMVHSLARRMAGVDEADELTQEVFVRVWRKLDTFRGEAAFGTWLHTVARNTILAHLRGRDRRRERFVEDEEGARETPVRPSPVGAALDLEEALESLPPGARRVFVLHDVEGYKHEEIAGMLGVTAGTSKSQLHRARMLMRASLAG